MPDYVFFVARLRMPGTGLGMFHSLRPMRFMPAFIGRLLGAMCLLRVLAFVIFVSAAPLVITIGALAKCRNMYCKS